MWEWVRRIPSPTYNKCGGASRDCSTRPPLDAMDVAFQEHDQNLYQSSLLSEPDKTWTRREADLLLHRDIKKIDPKTLSFYGKLYRIACLIIFK